MLPAVRASSAVYALSEPGLLGAAIPIAGAAGDQQAALYGQACFTSGMAKNTYGTGSFLLLNTGNKALTSQHGLVTTIAWDSGEGVQYALEGSIFVTGAAVQWLRDGLGIIASAGETESLAASVPDTAGVYFVPAFVGLGAPYWAPHARGTIVGLTRGTTRAHLVRATLEAIAYQTLDVIEAMQQDAAKALTELRVDGGATANDFLLQFQADLLGVPVDRPVIQETTALGAAYLAGLATGFWQTSAELAACWARDRRFEPRMSLDEREARYRGWQRAVECARAHG
jgi:glycerol kinase